MTNSTEDPLVMMRAQFEKMRVDALQKVLDVMKESNIDIAHPDAIAGFFERRLKVQPSLAYLCMSTFRSLENPDRGDISDYSPQMAEEGITDTDIINSRKAEFGSYEETEPAYWSAKTQEQIGAVIEAWRGLLIWARANIVNQATFDDSNMRAVVVLHFIHGAREHGWQRNDLEQVRRECLDIFFATRDVLEDYPSLRGNA